MITIPLYIIAFSGFINDINKESKIKIIISDQKTINPNIIKIAVLAITSVITSLMISLVSGFLVASVYMIISVREFTKAKNTKNTITFIVSSILLFLLLASIICIVPHKWEIREAYYKSTSAYSGESLGLVVLLLLFNTKLIINAIRMKDRYGKLLVIGISSLYIVQTVCNLLMNLGIIKLVEFNLPFISGGDVEWLMNIICMSLVLSVYRRKDINFENPKKSKLVAKIEDFFFEEAEEDVEVKNT